MKAIVVVLILLVSLSIRLTSASQPTRLYWQLPGEGIQLQARFQACHNDGCHQSLKNSNESEMAEWQASLLEAELLAEPGQNIQICARQLLGRNGGAPEKDTVLSVVSYNDIFVYQLRPRHIYTSLTLIEPAQCPGHFSTLYRYNAGVVFFSDAPFLVRVHSVQKSKKLTGNDQNDFGAFPPTASPGPGGRYCQRWRL